MRNDPIENCVFYKKKSVFTIEYAICISLLGIILLIFVCNIFVKGPDNLIKWGIPMIMYLSVLISYLITKLHEKHPKVFLSVSPASFSVKRRKYLWSDIDFIHYSYSYTRRHYHDYSLLIFIKKKKIPILINLTVNFTANEVKKIIRLFDLYNKRVDLWHSRLQKWFWS